MAPVSRIGVLTGGGDAPGLNAVIRAVVKCAYNSGIECVGLEDSFDGLIEPNRSRVLTPRDVRGIMRLGGTILGTVNSGNPFGKFIQTSAGAMSYSDRCIDMFHKMGLDALVVIGGDGTLGIAHQFGERGLPIVGVPKTIDNDIVGTTNCFGFDTAVAFATDAIDRLHTTAEAHRRIIVVEVMGRYAGWIALNSGIAGSAAAILIPEIPYDIERVVERVRERERTGRKYSIVVVAEGAAPIGGAHAVLGKTVGQAERLGGAGQLVADAVGQLTGKETRAVVLGHLLRGGTPTAFDRLLALRFGAAAVRALDEGESGIMVALDPPRVSYVPLAEATSRMKTVPLDSDSIKTARDLGIALGD